MFFNSFLWHLTPCLTPPSPYPHVPHCRLRGGWENIFAVQQSFCIFATASGERRYRIPPNATALWKNKQLGSAPQERVAKRESRANRELSRNCKSQEISFGDMPLDRNRVWEGAERMVKARIPAFLFWTMLSRQKPFAPRPHMSSVSTFCPISMTRYRIAPRWCGRLCDCLNT